MYYLIVNRETLTTHYIYESSEPDYNILNYFTDEIYEHIEIHDDLLYYTQYLKALRQNGQIVLYVDQNDKNYVDMETWKQIRLQRNQLLQETDFYLMMDYPINEMCRQETIVYRQRLRDIPQNHDSPFKVVWPDYPSFFMLNNNFQNKQ